MTGDHHGGTLGEQLCWSEPWMRFSARTASTKEVGRLKPLLEQPLRRSSRIGVDALADLVGQ
jgi:hypothetical protein